MKTIDLRYVQVSDDSSWHLIDDTWIDAFYHVRTRCGITRIWDQTFLDRLPGGDEKSCENCLLLMAGDAEPKAEPKKARKTK